MSSLPPISPRLTPTAPPAPNAAAVRDARALFFKALGEVPATAPAPVAKPATVFQAQPSPATTPAPSSGSDAATPRRPGSLLNILV